MKKILMILLATGCATLMYAQQKPSERPFAQEVRKIEEKKAMRKALVERQTDSMSVNSPRLPVAPPPAGKPSSRPVIVPARPQRNS